MPVDTSERITIPSVKTRLYQAKVRSAYYKLKEKEACESSYEAFVKSAWPILEPKRKLVWNWHLSVLCEEAQKQMVRIAKGEPKEYDLVINVPPRSLKSMLFVRMAAPWIWIKYPELRFMRGSYSETLATDHALETRELIQSE
jgi:hypothetical protein